MTKKSKYISDYKKKHYDHVLLDLRKPLKDIWKAAALKAGMPLAAYIRQAVNEKIN